MPRFLCAQISKLGQPKTVEGSIETLKHKFLALYEDLYRPDRVVVAAAEAKAEEILAKLREGAFLAKSHSETRLPARQLLQDWLVTFLLMVFTAKHEMGC
jgi:hypothetical protein